MNLSGEVAALLERHASERALDLLVGGGAAHPEHLVRVPPLRRSTRRPRRRGGGVALLRLERPEPRPRHGRPSSYFLRKLKQPDTETETHGTTANALSDLAAVGRPKSRTPARGGCNGAYSSLMNLLPTLDRSRGDDRERSTSR